MNYFAFNLLLAVIWVLLTGLGLGSLVLGFILGFLVLAFSRAFISSGAYVDGVMAVFVLTVVFLRELVEANVRLARDLLRRRPPFRHAFLRVEVGDLGPARISLLGALVSLTPGTVTVDVTDERSIVVHTIYAQDLQSVRQGVLRFARLIAGTRGGVPGDQADAGDTRAGASKP